MSGRTQRWPSAEGDPTSVHSRGRTRGIEHFVSNAESVGAADYHPAVVGENVSLAIVDAVAEPAGESSLEATSRYVASIANLPLIWHVFDELAEGGVERAVIVARAGVRRELEQVLDAGRSWGVEVSYSDAPEAGGQQTVLRKTRENLSSGPVLVYPADCLFPGQVAAMRDRFSAGDVDCVLLTQAPPESSLPGSRMFATAAMLGPRTREALGNSMPRGRAAGDIIETLHAGGCRVAVCEAAKQWQYSDSTERLLAANRMVLDDLPVPVVDGSFPDHNEVHGRVAISPRARVSNCTLHGPVVIDDDASRRRLVRRSVYSDWSRCHGSWDRTGQHHGAPVRGSPPSRHADRSKHHR